MNKFKVGDRVRLVRMEDEKSIYKEYLNKIFTIKRLIGDLAAELKETKKVVPYLKNLELVKDKYTYEDLKKSPIGTKVTFENGGILVKTTEKRLESRLSVTHIENLKNLKDDYYGKIIKIEEPAYTTVYESKAEILDEAEKRYLRRVIRPFKNRVRGIEKISYSVEEEFITIIVKDDGDINLPTFKRNTMYKEMEPNKEYTLEELGL